MAWGSITAANQERMVPVLKALYLLRNNEHFKTVTDFLQEKAAEEKNVNTWMEKDVQYRWNQGHIQVLDGIVALNETAEDELRKLGYH